MLKVKYLFVAICLSVLVGIVIVLQGNMTEKNAQRIENHPGQIPTNTVNIITIKPNYSLAFFLKLDSQYNTNLEIFAKNLKAGDYILIDGPSSRASEILNQAQEARSLVNTGVNVISVVGYKKINDLIETVPDLPKGIDYIMYDYEKGPGFSPEFTRDEKTSIGYFDKAKSAISQYNKNTGSDAKLFVTPPYGQLQNANWNWGLVASHMDVIDMQLQAYLKDPNLKNYTTNILEQIKKDTPDKLVFIQLSINPKKGALQDNLNALDSIKDVSGINAFLIYYLNYQGSDLKQFFSLLDR